MRKGNALLAAAILCTALLAAPPCPANAQEAGARAPAMEALERMSASLAGLERFRVEVQADWDVTQSSGQKLEFGEYRTITAQRPDKLRVQMRSRDGGSGGAVFDGSRITVWDEGQTAFSQVDRQGGIDDAIAFFTEDLDMRLPLAELFRKDLPAMLAPRVRESQILGKEFLGDVPCQHLTFRLDQIDLQLWVQDGPRPLPLRVVITYVDAVGAPQFRAALTDWDPAPPLTPDLFVFSPPKGFERIPLLVAAPGGRGDTAAPSEVKQ